MTIEITRHEIEAMIQQRLRSGAFESVEDVLFDALEAQIERLQDRNDAEYEKWREHAHERRYQPPRPDRRWPPSGSGPR